ncbi:SAF domain-containing protein [Ruania albidiflava]|uniref:SAF domain-containing protein n=1 Tax=Ruania albidiflava TaxID=366586 RepID=UPI0003B60F86|nr:SAF domain-containing protein [Ruania albidiflava]
MGSDPSPRSPAGRGLSARRLLRRLRPVLWRYRFVLAALCLAWTVVLVVPALQPAPPGQSVLVAERDLPAGTVLEARDLTRVELPEAPDAALGRGDLVGQRLAVAAPAGLPLVPSLLVGAGVAEGAPPGTVVAPVQLADPALVQLLQVGDRLDLYLVPAAGGPGEAQLVTSGALVLSLLGSPEGAVGLLGGTGDQHSGVVVVAADSADATLLTGTNGLASFRAVVVPAHRASSE